MSTLDNLRKNAKRWLQALRDGDAQARARLVRAYPGAPEQPTLRDVQHALARERGHDSWIALSRAVADRAKPETPLIALLDAAGKGDAARVAAILDEHPDLINQRGTLPANTGLRTALHFGVGHEAVVKALLDRGADPNIRDEGDASGKEFIIARSEVGTIVAQVRDDLANGALIGAGVGLSAALTVLAIVGSQDGYVLRSAKWGAPLLLSGLGGLAGMLVDRAHKRERTVYVAS